MVACFLVGIKKSLFLWSISFVSSMLQSSVKLLEGTSSEIFHGCFELVNEDALEIFFFFGGGDFGLGLFFFLCSLSLS